MGMKCDNETSRDARIRQAVDGQRTQRRAHREEAADRHFLINILTTIVMAINKFCFHFPSSVHLPVSADKQKTTRLSIQILVTGLQGALSEISTNIPLNHGASRLQPLMFCFFASQQVEGCVESLQECISQRVLENTSSEFTFRNPRHTPCQKPPSPYQESGTKTDLHLPLMLAKLISLSCGSERTWRNCLPSSFK